MLVAKRRFLARDRLAQLRIERGRVGGVMCATMTVGANPCHAIGQIKPAVAQSVDVMRFQKRRTGAGGERRGLVASFAYASGSSDHIGSYLRAPHVDRARGASGCSCSRRGSVVRALSQIAEKRRAWLQVRLLLDLESLDRHKLENKSISRRTGAVRLHFNLIAIGHELPEIFYERGRSNLLEEQEVAASEHVIPYSSVAPNHLHRPDLPLARVPERAIRHEAIAVVRRFSPSTGEEEYSGIACQRDHAPLRVARKDAVQLAGSTISAIGDERPEHRMTLPRRAPRRNAVLAVLP